jgi:hypothetical protein
MDEKRPNGVPSGEGRILHSCLFIMDRIKRDLSPLSIGFNFVDELCLPLAQLSKR